MTQDSLHFDGTLAVIGGGRMGEAIVRGLIDADAITASNVIIAEPDAARRDELAAAYGVRCVAGGAEALPAGIALLAIKPQVADSVIKELAGSFAGSLVVSIIAGFSSAKLESLMPAGTTVVRVMPNTPMMVGEGMAVVSGGSEASAQQVELVREIFATVGRAIVVAERYQNVATAISGSGPAYFALVIDALARAGVRQGLPRDVAQVLAVQTMLGTARMIDETGIHPEVLIDGVSSPGGTTIAAVEALEAGGLRAAFAEAVAANVARSQELGS